MSTSSIIDWLNGIPTSSTEPIIGPPPLLSTKTRKRRRPLTPSDSTDLDDIMPRKSQRQEDLDTTPRPKRIQLPHSESNYSLTSGSSAASTASGSHSPQKQMKALNNAEDGIEERELSSLKDHPSPSLKEFMKKMKQIAKGQGIMSPSIKDSIAEHSDEDIAALEHDFYFSKDRDNFGYTPSPEEVIEIYQAAAECKGHGHSEATWNTWVHNTVLQLALKEPGNSIYRQLVSYMPCSTASIIPDYLPSLKIPKKVDFCIYLDPAYDQKHTNSGALISSICSRLPDQCINHTDYTPLAKRPLAVSIETKKLLDNWNKATLQLSVCQAAQWNFFQELTPPDRVLADNETLDYIPGIIIQGRNWFLAVTTREDKKTIFWNKLDLGATDTIEGIYKIVYGLQVLRQWAEDEYWPAFRNRVASNIDAHNKALEQAKAKAAQEEAVAVGGAAELERELVLPQ